MTNQFHKLLLSELHMAVYTVGNPDCLDDRLLCEAVTLNENLQSLGYILKPADLLSLAVSPSLHTFFEDVRALVPEVKAQPMYPGFPLQVMQMSEAEMKWNQFLHTFSILGVEWLTGTKVRKGWMPDTRILERNVEDTTLLDAHVLELIPRGEAAVTALKVLMERRERLTCPELELVLESAAACSAEQMQGLKVRFKENLELLFPLLLEKADREAALRTLRVLCTHTGDVFRCTAAYLARHRHHLRTGEKRLLVKLLESYPVWNFRQNLMQSASVRERNLVVLRHLDYNQYSRSPEHAQAVRALRSGELLSWHGIGEELLKQSNPRALAHYAQRPGVMLRMLNRLLSLGYQRDAIADVLLPGAGAISTQLILQAIRGLANREENLEEKREAELERCRQKYRHMCYRFDDWNISHEFYWKKENCQRDYEQRYRQLVPQCIFQEAQEKACAEAERQRREAASRMEEQLQQVRKTVEEALRPLREEVERKSKLLKQKKDLFRRWPSLRAVARYNMTRSGCTEEPTDEVLLRYLPEHQRRKVEQLQQERDALKAQLTRERTALSARMAQELRKLRKECETEYALEVSRIDGELEQELEQLEQILRQPDPYVLQREALLKELDEALAKLDREEKNTLARLRKLQQDLPRREKKELEAIEEKYRRIQRCIPFNDDAVDILKELLFEHFCQVVTPLKGKKVFCDLQQYDLERSSLETGNRSDEGGYIRSGISYRIPDGAKYVRFFVYWNDPSPVIVDLHAGGKLTGGESFHVGWNTCFHGPGVLHSGDVLHSDAAQYVDIDLSAPLQEVYTNIHLWAGKQRFRDIETCYVGMMAVDRIGQEVKLYSPKNCFFSHQLTQDTANLFYGFVDVPNRCVRFVGQPNQDFWEWAERPRMDDTFSLQDYLDCVLDGQQAELVNAPEEADVILTMGKGMDEKSISLADHNFFLEC